MKHILKLFLEQTNKSTCQLKDLFVYTEKYTYLEFLYNTFHIQRYLYFELSKKDMRSDITKSELMNDIDRIY